VVGDEPEEEPPDIHTTKKEVKKIQLNTLSPTSKVFSAHEPQETTLYLVHENDYKGDMLTMTYKEDGFIKDYKQYTMYTQHEAAYREDKDAKTFKGNLMIGDTYKEDVLAITFEEKDVLPMFDNAYKEDMLTVSTQENVVLVNAYEKYVRSAMNKTTNQEDVDAESNKNLIDNGQKDMQKTNLMKSAMNKTTIQEDVDAKNYMMSNMNLIIDGHKETQKTCLLYKRGTEEDAQRLAVSAIASKRGERGA
jgi:hypothetical protein